VQAKFYHNKDDANRSITRNRNIQVNYVIHKFDPILEGLTTKNTKLAWQQDLQDL
jgi:hypothetical protein